MSTVVKIGSWTEISTTVAKNNKDVDDSIEKFLCKNKNFVIGLDIELSFS